MKIALMQMNIIWEDKRINLKKAEELLQKASGEGCDLAVFPEMFATGFSMNHSEIAESLDGPVLKKLKTLAIEMNISIMAGVAVALDKRYENCAFVISRKGEITSRYTKNYLFSYSDEDQNYESGTDQVIFKIDGVPSTVFICYDLRFPELFRTVAKSVSFIFVIANWPESRIDQWDALIKARAIENQCFVIAVNRTGKDGCGLEYNGHSMAIDPMGEKIEPLVKRDEWVVVEIDEKETDFVRERFPFLKDLKD
jgi:predicted amidohydrolase